MNASASTWTQDFHKFLRDDTALLRAARARWLLVPAAAAGGVAAHASGMDATDAVPAQGHDHGLRIALPECALHIASGGLTLGRHAECCVVVDHPEVSKVFQICTVYVDVDLISAKAKPRLQRCICVCVYVPPIFKPKRGRVLAT